jgi:hypothetical protein
MPSAWSGGIPLDRGFPDLKAIGIIGVEIRDRALALRAVS